MIKEINSQEKWENFLKGCEEKTFLQSWNWGEFNKLMGKKIWRLGIYKEEELGAVCLVVKIEARRATYLLIEHGPVNKNGTWEARYKLMKELIFYLKKIAEEEGASFIRVCPIWKNAEENKRAFQDTGFRQAVMHEHPEISWVLDVDKSEEELLAGMRKTTRYLIRRASKNSEIEIIKRKEIESVRIFNEIYQETVRREHFFPFPLHYLENEFLSFSKDDQIIIFLGKYRGEIISGAMIIFWQDSAFYHQGASLRKYAKIPVNYLLQWEAIKEARRRGLKHYSFWGIAPEDKINHPWKGLTLFKKGFGGRKEEYVKTQDFIISKRYWLNYFIEYLRRIKRRL